MIEGGVGGGSRRTGLDLGSGAVSGCPDRKPQFSRDLRKHWASLSDPWQCSRGSPSFPEICVSIGLHYPTPGSARGRPRCVELVSWRLGPATEPRSLSIEKRRW